MGIGLLRARARDVDDELWAILSPWPNSVPERSRLEGVPFVPAAPATRPSVPAAIPRIGDNRASPPPVGRQSALVSEIGQTGGQFASAAATIRFSCSRVAPPTACTASPFDTVMTYCARNPASASVGRSPSSIARWNRSRRAA